MYKYPKIKDLDSKEITSLPKRKNVMNVARHFNYRGELTACSSRNLIEFTTQLRLPHSTNELSKRFASCRLPQHASFAHKDSSLGSHRRIHLTKQSLLSSDTIVGRSIFPKLSSQKMHRPNANIAAGWIPSFEFFEKISPTSLVLQYKIQKNTLSQASLVRLILIETKEF